MASNPARVLALLAGLSILSFPAGPATAGSAEPLSCDTSISLMQESYRSGAFTVEDDVRWYANRIARFDRTGPRLEAIAFADIDRALVRARELDALPQSVRDAMPLFGVPIVIKDMIDVAGLPTAFGSALLAKSPARRDAEVVARLRAAGAIVLGKSTMSGDSRPFLAGFSAQGLTINPFDSERDPQGSSTGSGVAVAAGMAMAGIGEETTDSIRGVADASGLASIRATRGRVPMDGIYPLSRNLDVVGPLAHRVSDAARLIDVMTGCSTGHGACVAVGADPVSLKGVRLGVPATYAGQNSALRRIHFSPDTLRTFESALNELRALGAVIVPVERPAGSPHDFLSQPGDTEYKGLGIPDWTSSDFRAQDDRATTLTLNRYFREHGSGAFTSIDAIIDAMRTPSDLDAANGLDDLLTAQYFDDLRISARRASDTNLLERFDAAEDRLYRRDVVDVAIRYRLDAFVFPTAFRPPLTVIEALRDQYFSGEHVFAAAPIDFGVPAVTVAMPAIAANMPATLTFIGLRNQDARIVAIADAYERATEHQVHPAAFCQVPGKAR